MSSESFTLNNEVGKRREERKLREINNSLNICFLVESMQSPKPCYMSAPIVLGRHKGSYLTATLYS